jgi:hypothetical protein
MNTKYFIWIVRVSICLWEFFWKFWNFLSIFRDFKPMFKFCGIVFALKLISEKYKSYPILLGWARRPDPSLQAQPAGPLKPIWSQRSPPATETVAATATPPLVVLGFRAKPTSSRVPIKGRNPSSHACPSSLHRPSPSSSPSPAPCTLLVGVSSSPPSRCSIRRRKTPPEEAVFARSFTVVNHI